jgi:hypothetical protein
MLLHRTASNVNGKIITVEEAQFQKPRCDCCHKKIAEVVSLPILPGPRQKGKGPLIERAAVTTRPKKSQEAI